MGAVKSKSEMIECYSCHQLVMFNATQEISIPNGPDDCDTVPMCDDCAETFEQDTPEWEPDETEPLQTVNECASKATRSMHKLLPPTGNTK